MNKLPVRLILLILYILLFLVIGVIQEEGFRLLSSKAYFSLGIVFITFWGGGLTMSYLKRNEKKKEYNFVRRFFLSFAAAGIIIGIVNIFMGEYAQSLGILTVCTSLLLGMLTPFSPDKNK